MDEASALKSPHAIADACREPSRARSAEACAVDLDEMIAAHGQSLARLVARLVDRHQDVEDLVQETFLAAWTSRGRFRGQCKMSTWLARIAVNKCRSHHRWRRVRKLVRLTPGDATSNVAELGSNEAQEDGEEVRSAVRRLPVKYREAVVLRYFEDTPIDEMAEVLNLSRAAVEKRLSRARQRLKEMLSERT
jgi:RNA polymerase sigma-70 factor (ECF subfamily)